MANPLSIAPPPPRRPKPEAEGPPKTRRRVVATPKFSQVKEDQPVQFNKRLTRRVADGYEMLAIRTRRKVPDLLAEALEMLEERYGKI